MIYVYAVLLFSSDAADNNKSDVVCDLGVYGCTNDINEAQILLLVQSNSPDRGVTLATPQILGVQEQSRESPPRTIHGRKSSGLEATTR